MLKSEDFNKLKIRPSKHFILGWMRKWSWDDLDIRNELTECYKIEKVGKNKYEVYTRNGAKNGSKKIILVMDEEYQEVFIITGAEGK